MNEMTERIERYRAMARVYLQDAVQPELSLGGRANAAFDACYMLCRVVLNGDDAEWEHPYSLVLVHTAGRLGWPYYDIVPAIDHLENWYAPEIAGMHYDALMELARRLEAATAQT